MKIKNLTRFARRTMIPAVLGIGLLAAPAVAGPIGDYNAQYRDAYADYRSALFMTNQGDPAKSAKAIAAFATKWQALTDRYGATPPPQFGEDPQWPDTLGQITAVTTKAASEARSGELAEAHETLEAIRDLLTELRARNGVVDFSDPVNAYHEEMEAVLGMAGKPGLASPDTLRDMTGRLAVLRYLAGEIKARAPAALAEKPPFRESLAAIFTAIDKAEAAVAGGQAETIGKSIKALKPTYAKFFLKFG